MHAIITTGGTGFYIRDSMPEAVSVLFDKSVDGFGEMFRLISKDDIGMSTIQSRAVAGMANGTGIFAYPAHQALAALRGKVSYKSSSIAARVLVILSRTLCVPIQVMIN